MTPREHLETLAAMHLEVAAYVEKLSGPDREVDAKIAAVMGGGWLREGAEVPAYTGSPLETAAALRARASALTGYREKG